MMETVSSSEEPVDGYQTTKYNIPEDSHFLAATFFSFQVVALLLFVRFAESSKKVKIFYLHEEGFANEITTEYYPQMKLVKINKYMHYVTFHLPLGFVKRHDDFYKRMTNRSITVATDTVSRPNVPVTFCFILPHLPKKGQLLVPPRPCVCAHVPE
jgi:hypothetical protein